MSYIRALSIWNDLNEHDVGFSFTIFSSTFTGKCQKKTGISIQDTRRPIISQGLKTTH